MYICEMSNGVGQPVRHSTMLYVQEPPVIVRESRNQIVKEGGDIQLDCVVKGSPAPRITWLLNGEPITNDSHVETAGKQEVITSCPFHIME
ncbi:hemolin-like [Cryptotermes secundus]|uniref:hemolin-like n=1 Tax=Cryptotermes secundus TaxID=105785 RepID=UPI001454C7F8|nr:hemolin-like [Cryptotermes secundus]